MDHGIFQIIASDERRLEVYVEAYNEIYPTLYNFACMVDHSIWTHKMIDEMKYALYGCVSAATVRIEPRFVKSLMYHMITDIGLRLNNSTLMYHFIEVLEDMNHVI